MSLGWQREPNHKYEDSEPNDCRNLSVSPEKSLGLEQQTPDGVTSSPAPKPVRPRPDGARRHRAQDGDATTVRTVKRRFPPRGTIRLQSKTRRQRCDPARLRQGSAVDFDVELHG